MPFSEYVRNAVRLRPLLPGILEWIHSTSLPFTMQPQTQSNWCWAATATSVSLFYRSSSGWTQCSVASDELGLSCCNSPVPGGCNIPWYLNLALTRTDNFVSYGGPMTFDEVERELGAGRVVGARIGWSGGGGHFMVIYGTLRIGPRRYFQIDDPIYGKSQLTVADFSTNYQGSGSWTHAYLTKRPRPLFPFDVIDIPKKLIDLFGDYHPEWRTTVGRPIARDVALALPHAGYTLGLDQLAPKALKEARPAFYRAVVMAEGKADGFVDWSEEADIIQTADADNPYVAGLERALAAAMSDDARRDAQPRLLRIPALYTDVLWLHGRGKDVGVVIASAQDLPVGKAMPIDDLLGRLKELGATLKKQMGDDDLLGS